MVAEAQGHGEEVKEGRRALPTLGRPLRARRVVVYGTLAAGVALVLVTGVIAPRWYDGGLLSDERAAIATLRYLRSAQEDFREGAFADENGNGVGEYGSLAELSGAAPVRGGKALVRPLIGTAFRTVGALGVSRAQRSGYWFQVFFAAPGGETCTENLRGGLRPGDLDPALAEKFWCAYAWPVEHGSTGLRTFFVNQEGDVLATDDHRYSGKHGPRATAAFAPEGSGITGAVAMDGEGRDGNTWKPVN